MQRLISWFGANPLRPAIASIALILLLGTLAPIFRAPRQDLNWDTYLSHTPDVEMTATEFHVAPVSDWSYAGREPTAETYTDASFDFDALRGVWFILEPQPGSQLAAHTLLLFEFEGDRLLGLTIEARREANEGYSAVRGIFNAFELSYIWASARDLLVRRAVMLDHEVFIYHIDISDEQQRVLLTRLLQRTEDLETTPRFYNTITSNCTNELAKAAGFHWAPAYILTGRSDEYLFRRGIIPGGSFERTHARSDMTEFVQALNQAPPEAFDRALLQELRRRFEL